MYNWGCWCRGCLPGPWQMTVASRPSPSCLFKLDLDGLGHDSLGQSFSSCPVSQIGTEQPCVWYVFPPILFTQSDKLVRFTETGMGMLYSFPFAVPSDIVKSGKDNKRCKMMMSKFSMLGQENVLALQQWKPLPLPTQPAEQGEMR